MDLARETHRIEDKVVEGRVGEDGGVSLGILWWFNGILMGFYGILMGFIVILMGFYGGLMGF